MCNITINCCEQQSKKVYVALLKEDENGLNISVLENTIGNIIWTVDGVGEYYATLSNAFTEDKTAVYATPNEGSFSFGGFSDSVDTVYFSATNLEEVYESGFRSSNVTIKIEVYN